jgi:hypothetical protein
MQLCFWDLTDEVLRERPAQHGRSRLTSVMTSSGAAAATTASNSNNLPHVVMHGQYQGGEYTATSGYGSEDHTGGTTVSGLSTVSGSVSGSSSGGLKAYNHHHHSTASSIMSSAKNMFSSKHSEKLTIGDKAAK